MSEKLVIIDGNSILYRSFYALPLLNNTRGEYSNAIYGFAMQILNVIQTIKPKYIVVAFDVSKHTFRNDIYDGYKATRKPMPDELKSQIEPVKAMLKKMDIKIAEQQGLEGDDIIGIVSKMFPETETIIVTGDRDSFQLVDKTTKVYFTKKGTSDVKIMGEKELREEYGVSPKEFIDLKALQGDTADNIPGVSGIGPKTATELIQKYGSVEGLYNHIDELSGKTKEKLVLGKENAFMSKVLATIKTEGDLGFSLSDCEYEFPFSSEVYDFFKYYEFKSLIRTTSNFDMTKGAKSDIVYEVQNIISEDAVKELVQKIKAKNQVAIYFSDGEIHVSLGEKEYVVKLLYDLINGGIEDQKFYACFKEIFEDESILKICYDAKKDMYHLKPYGIKLNNFFDASIAKYLVDGVPVDGIKDIFFEEKINYIATKLYVFAEEYRKKIDNEKLQFLYEKVEIPLSKVLFSMENTGFKLDIDVLLSLKEKYKSEQDLLEKEIYKLAGEEFNLNSPKQLAKILYEKFGLTHDKKQSTSAENLEMISSEHEIVKVILRYRKVSKFLSTYIDGLLPHVDKNNHIHTYFKQTLTTTGRLSSTEPNLQNIPIRSEESREIRSMFVASSKDNVLIDADYSQIELRLLAHCSEDKSLVDAFLHDADIHTKTASEVFGVKESEVTPEMRRTAKIVNFGIIYGISEYGLAEDLKISSKQAREYINSFYASHIAVRAFMDKSIESARETGKATSLFGRVRKMFDIKSSNYNVRTRAERASQNMPLQGSAADIIKIAMVNTYNALKSGGFAAKLIMQVHDELIIDAPKSEEEQVKKLLKEQMEKAADLIVPLEVDVRSSYRWSEGH